ncbi:uncharacterized protein BKA78DRAFT_47717 [Phyllosticta capitalensis]|uniref:uncharacterized protein n=1 Tax=Phyllosticta capitalensis TaxID=121624 RepID=UPI00312F1A24
MDRQAASARRASASALTSMSACGEEGKSGNGDVQRDDGEKRRRNDEEDDVATVPAAAAVRPASTSSGTLPISAAVDSNYATTTNVESQKFRKSGERGEEDARRLGSSTSLGCAARRHGPITTTQHPDSPPPDYDDCVARAHRDGPLPQTCSSSVADQAMATAAASGVSTTSASTAKSTSTSSSRSKTKDDQPDKEKEYGSHDSNSKPSKDKGKRRADDFSNATGAQHKNDDMLDDTKLSNPNLREATELAALPRPFSSSSSSMSSSATGSRVSQRRVYSGVDATAGGVGSLSQTRSGGSGSSSVRSNLTGPLWWQGVQRWWGRQVSVTVEVKGMRDHLGESVIQPLKPLIIITHPLTAAFATNSPSTRTHLPRLPTDEHRAQHDGGDTRAAVPAAALAAPRRAPGVLRAGDPAGVDIHRVRHRRRAARRLSLLAPAVGHRPWQGSSRRVGGAGHHGREPGGMCRVACFGGIGVERVVD